MEMLRLLATAAVLLVLTPLWVDSAVTAITKSKGHVLVERGVLSTRPSSSCNSGQEGTTVPVDSETVWLCKDGKWLPYRLQNLYGTSSGYAAYSCREVRDVHPSTPPSGGYYLNITDQCTNEGTIMKVYCNMDEDGGGWTLVWKHSAMEVGNLTDDMRYFSDYYKACTDLEVGWCNIPNKDRLNPTEMMIAAYHKKEVVFAYKGIFNKNLDWHWSGGILMDPTKVVDLCASNNGVQPAPYIINNWGGLSFDKVSPDVYTTNCDMYYSTLSSPLDCRWAHCRLPTSISSTTKHTQMTVAIYVR